MNKLSYEEFLNLEWETTTFKEKNSILSIGLIKNYNKITFMTNKKFEDKSIIDRLGLTELKELPVKYVVTK